MASSWIEASTGSFIIQGCQNQELICEYDHLGEKQYNLKLQTCQEVAINTKYFDRPLKDTYLTDGYVSISYSFADLNDCVTAVAAGSTLIARVRYLAKIIVADFPHSSSRFLVLCIRIYVCMYTVPVLW